MMQSQDGQVRVKRGRQARNRGASQLANQHVGERIRIRRTLLGMSQSELGKVLGLSFQQMQKYEHGVSSIGAGQLCGIATALDVPVSFFYDGLDGVSVPPNSDAGGRRNRLDRHELEVLGHYRAAPVFIQDAIRSLLGHLSNQGPGHDRDLAAGTAAKQEYPAAGTTLADDTGRTPTRDGAGPYQAEDEFSGIGADTEPSQKDAGGMPGSAPPELGQARSEPREQPVPVRRRRGRPRKIAGGETEQAEPVPVGGRSGEGAISASDTPPAKSHKEQDAIRDPRGAAAPVESADRLPAKSDRPDWITAEGGTPADGKAAGGTFSRADKSPASGIAKPNRKSPRRAYGATWSPSDISK